MDPEGKATTQFDDEDWERWWQEVKDLDLPVIDYDVEGR